jgi:hypothetical protein
MDRRASTDMRPEGPRTRALLLRRHRRRQRMVSALGVLAVAALLGVVGLAFVNRAGGHRPGSGAPAADPRTADPGTGDPGAGGDPSLGASPAGGSSPGPVPSFPSSGPNSFTYAGGSDQVLGRGTADPKRYRIAVENGTGQDLAGFAGAVGRILADPRGWTAGGDVRFQQVAKDAARVDVTILLATQATSERICSIGGVHTEQLTSCRLPGQIVINLTRWLTAIPGYGAALDEYRAYEINYAVGRDLGHGNEACPNPGQPAPVMQKQVLGLKGCTANGWPYRDGKRYSGPPVP